MRTLMTIAVVLLLSLGQVAYADTPASSGADKTSGPQLSPDEILLNAYKREFAFLEAERDALRRQVSELDARMNKKLGAARTAVEGIQQRVADQDLVLSATQKALDEIESVQSTQESPAELFTNLKSRTASAFAQLGRTAIDAAQFANV